MQTKKVVLGIAISIRIIIVLLVIFIIGEWLWWISPKADEPRIISYNYYHFEKTINREPFLLFSKYYYHDELGEIANNKYVTVGENIEIIKKYFNISLNRFSELNDSIEIEFNYDNITSNDLYLLKYIKDENLLILHFYDEDNHILYTTYFNK